LLPLSSVIVATAAIAMRAQRVDDTWLEKLKSKARRHPA
jgi:hypothetical protein